MEKIFLHLFNIKKHLLNVKKQKFSTTSIETTISNLVKYNEQQKNHPKGEKR